MSDAQRKPPMDAAESETLRMRGNSLHGNRETLETPSPQGGGRSEKAYRRTSDVHVSRESGPGKGPRKGAQERGPRKGGQALIEAPFTPTARTCSLRTRQRGCGRLPPTTGDHTSTAYDLLGRTVTATDQRGVTHTCVYDSAGRLSANKVTDFGPSGNVDTTVTMITTGYDDLGRRPDGQEFGLRRGYGNRSNEVLDQYDGWGNLAKEYQKQTVRHHGGGRRRDRRNPLRRLRLRRRLRFLLGRPARPLRPPDGRCLPEHPPDRLQLRGGGGQHHVAVDGHQRRQQPSDGTYSAYTYLGAGTIASESYTTPEVRLDYDPGGDGSFTALDRFGRVVDQIWAGYGDNSSTGVVDGYRYGYDAAGNRVWKENVTARISGGPRRNLPIRSSSAA